MVEAQTEGIVGRAGVEAAPTVAGATGEGAAAIEEIMGMVASPTAAAMVETVAKAKAVRAATLVVGEATEVARAVA